MRSGFEQDTYALSCCVSLSMCSWYWSKTGPRTARASPLTSSDAGADSKALCKHFTDAVSAHQTNFELGGMSHHWEEKLGMTRTCSSRCSVPEPSLALRSWPRMILVLRQSHDLRKVLAYLAKTVAHRSRTAWTRAVSRKAVNMRSPLSWGDQTASR